MFSHHSFLRTVCPQRSILVTSFERRERSCPQVMSHIYRIRREYGVQRANGKDLGNLIGEYEKLLKLVGQYEKRLELVASTKSSCGIYVVTTRGQGRCDVTVSHLQGRCDVTIDGPDLHLKMRTPPKPLPAGENIFNYVRKLSEKKVRCGGEPGIALLPMALNEGLKKILEDVGGEVISDGDVLIEAV